MNKFERVNSIKDRILTLRDQLGMAVLNSDPSVPSFADVLVDQLGGMLICFSESRIDGLTLRYLANGLQSTLEMDEYFPASDLGRQVGEIVAFLISEIPAAGYHAEDFNRPAEEALPSPVPQAPAAVENHPVERQPAAPAPARVQRLVVDDFGEDMPPLARVPVTDHSPARAQLQNTESSPDALAHTPYPALAGGAPTGPDPGSPPLSKFESPAPEAVSEDAHLLEVPDAAPAPHAIINRGEPGMEQDRPAADYPAELEAILAAELETLLYHEEPEGDPAVTGLPAIVGTVAAIERETEGRFQPDGAAETPAAEPPGYPNVGVLDGSLETASSPEQDVLAPGGEEPIADEEQEPIEEAAHANDAPVPTTNVRSDPEASSPVAGPVLLLPPRVGGGDAAASPPVASIETPAADHLESEVSSAGPAVNEPASSLFLDLGVCALALKLVGEVSPLPDTDLPEPQADDSLPDDLRPAPVTLPPPAPLTPASPIRIVRREPASSLFSEATGLRQRLETWFAEPFYLNPPYVGYLARALNCLDVISLSLGETCEIRNAFQLHAGVKALGFMPLRLTGFLPCAAGIDVFETGMRMARILDGSQPVTTLDGAGKILEMKHEVAALFVALSTLSEEERSSIPGLPYMVDWLGKMLRCYTGESIEAVDLAVLRDLAVGVSYLVFDSLLVLPRKLSQRAIRLCASFSVEIDNSSWLWG